MTVGDHLSWRGIGQGEAQRGAGERDKSVASIVELSGRRQTGQVDAGVADDGEGIDAAEIVAALVPGGQVPKEGTAGDQFGALRPSLLD